MPFFSSVRPSIATSCGKAGGYLFPGRLARRGNPLPTPGLIPIRAVSGSLVPRGSGAEGLPTRALEAADLGPARPI
jgi:hypothetical protein